MSRRGTQGLHRFGWVVEIDPFDPGSTPVKRTALGRIKHESATVTEGKGRRIVVYTGDDENLDYVYKFVGDKAWPSVRARGRSPLDEGTLYVGCFDADGTGTWLPLAHGSGPLTKAKGWRDQADVLLRTREAADAVGATKLHRPEWVAVDPRTKDVYLTLTNGSGTQNPTGGLPPRHIGAADEAANGGAARAASNPFGHILRWREARGDNAALTFTWDVFILAGDPTKPPGADATVPDEARFGSPDGLWVDPDRRVWIQTDVSNGAQLLGDYDRTGNNAMLAADPTTGQVKRFLTGPKGCEITGVITTPDQRTMFINVQHPGESTAAIGTPTVEDPRAVSAWPFRKEARPRPAVVAVRKLDGGKIGT